MVAPIRYAKSGTLNLAYQVVGEGPVDLVFVPGFVSHLDAAWEDPRLSRFLFRLASFSRLILFDKRGIGMSDSGPGLPSVQDRVDDLLAVLDAAASNQATLLAPRKVALPASASRRPIPNGSARWRRSEPSPR